MQAGFKAKRTELVAALESVRHVVAKGGRSTRSILENCRIVGDTARGLVIAGTDLETWITAKVAGASFSGIEGGILVPLHDALGFLKACEGEEATAEYRAGVLTFQTDAGETLELPSDDVSEYRTEPVERLEAHGSVVLAAGELARMLKSTIPSAAREAGQYAMHAIQLRLGGAPGSLRMIATDGRRLAVADVLRISESQGAPAVGLLPIRAAEIVSKILARNRKTEGDARVTVDAREARFALPCGVSIMSCAMAGEFPRVDSVIPPVGSGNVVVRLPVAETIRRLKLVSGACGAEMPVVRVSVAEGEVLISTGAHRKKSSARVMGAEVSKGEGTIGVNPAYLSEALSSSGEQTCTLSFRDPTMPMRIDGGVGFFAVVMPIKMDA